MIKLQDLTPAVYYDQSRDFQFIGRLYDIVLNYSKTNAANLYNLPAGKNMDEQLLNLLALTLGFKPTKKYNSKQLRAICSALPTILKSKGSIQSLVLATNALLAAEGVKQPLDYTMHPKEGITLYVAQELDDLSLFTDLLDYLLPAGLSCNIVKESQRIAEVTTNIGVNDSVNISGVDAMNTIRDRDEAAIAEIRAGRDLGDALEASNVSIITQQAHLQDLQLGNVGVHPGAFMNASIMQEQLDTNTTSGGENK